METVASTLGYLVLKSSAVIAGESMSGELVAVWASPRSISAFVTGFGPVGSLGFEVSEGG